MNKLQHDSWTYDEKVSLFKLMVSHIGEYDRNKWKMRYAYTPLDYNTQETIDVMSAIVEDLRAEYDDPTFNINGCGFIIQYAVSMGDNLDVYQSNKDETRLAALEAGFIDDDTLNYIEELDNPENSTLLDIVNGKLTPEQMLPYFDRPVVKIKLTQDYPKYKKGEAWAAVTNFHNIKSKDLPKHIRNKAKEEMNDVDNAYIQLSKAKAIIEAYIISNMAK